MSNVTRGLDHDLKVRAEQKRSLNKDREEEILKWVEAVTGDTIDRKDVQQSLKNGKILCNLINKISPGKVKFNKLDMPFAHRENIANFLRAAKDLGVPDFDRFMSVDLYENKNMGQVMQCLESLGRICQTIKGYKGPVIGAKIAQKQERKEFKNPEGYKMGLMEAQIYELSKSKEPTYSIKHQIQQVDKDTFMKMQEEALEKKEGKPKEKKDEPKKEETKEEKKEEKKEEPPKEKPKSSLKDLETLKNLKDKGILTEEEYEKKKKQILENL